MEKLGKYLKLLLIVLLTVGVVCSCCCCAVYVDEVQVPTEPTKDSLVSTLSYSDNFDDVISSLSSKDTEEIVIDSYSDYLESSLSSDVVTRGQWLTALDERLDCKDKYDMYADLDMRSYVTRQFVARTLVDMVGYDIECKLECSDKSSIEFKTQVATAIYLGYFEVDEQGDFGPRRTVSLEQVESILHEIDMINALKGKHILSFGDSIMHGDGNGYVGIAELMAQKYLMTAKDYSKGGATLGFADGREQISRQIQRATQNEERADIILINGGTNDMRRVELGSISDNFDFRENGREYFSNGMEYAFGLIKEYYEGVPFVYIRSHDMEFALERNELHYGAAAQSICDKWGVPVADVFNDSGFNAHDEQIKSKYTAHTSRRKNGDSVHPNRIGYYKYYIPLTAQKVRELLISEG